MEEGFGGGTGPSDAYIGVEWFPTCPINHLPWEGVAEGSQIGRSFIS